MHFVKARGILSANNGMNLYRGCQHGCIYCDSRSRCYHIDHRFEDVAVKANGVELLELALKRKRRPCMIGTGSMSDPYTPIERQRMLTRKALWLRRVHPDEVRHDSAGYGYSPPHPRQKQGGGSDDPDHHGRRIM